VSKTRNALAELASELEQDGWGAGEPTTNGKEFNALRRQSDRSSTAFHFLAGSAATLAVIAFFSAGLITREPSDQSAEIALKLEAHAVELSETRRTLQDNNESIVDLKKQQQKTEGEIIALIRGEMGKPSEETMRAIKSVVEDANKKLEEKLVKGAQERNDHLTNEMLASLGNAWKKPDGEFARALNSGLMNASKDLENRLINEVQKRDANLTNYFTEKLFRPLREDLKTQSQSLAKRLDSAVAATEQLERNLTRSVQRLDARLQELQKTVGKRPFPTPKDREKKTKR
jgi:hypothetical protein